MLKAMRESRQAAAQTEVAGEMRRRRRT